MRAGGGFALVAALLLGVAPLPARAASASLELAGHDSLGDRGLNAGLALAGRCAYVGSRGSGPVVIEDLADPTGPHKAGSIPGRANTTARELRAVDDLHLLVVMSYALGPGGLNRFDLYLWDSDCRQPRVAGTYDFGAAAPHEFFAWRDPAPGASRLLLFTTMFGGAAPQLRVIEAGNPAHPVEVGNWQPPAGILHSISLDATGRAYLSLWTGGFAIADASDFTLGRAQPALRMLSGVLPAPAGGNVHSAVVAPGERFAVVTDERYPPGCPYGPARTVDVSDPANPRPLAVLPAPENDPAQCRAAASGTYTSHNPTLTSSLAFITWYSSGLQAWDLSDPARPVRLAEYRPAFGGTPGNIDGELGSTTTLAWSYPVLREGLIYFVDINQGLVVLRYRGPHEDEVAQAAFTEGNSNLTGSTALAPSPVPTPGPSPSHVPTASEATTKAGGGDSTPPMVVLLLGLAAVAIGGALVFTRPRKRR